MTTDQRSAARSTTVAAADVAIPAGFKESK